VEESARNLLRADGLSKVWDAKGPEPIRALRGVSLALAAGETVVVTGPSGSGKTTLLSILGGLLTPDAGQVLFDGIDLAAAAEPERRAIRLRRIGFVFQRGLLLENLSARQNVALVPRAAGLGRAAAESRATDLLARLGLAQRAHLYPHALSAGECQRVAVARAVAMRPALVLADEQTAHLDGHAGAQVMEVLRALARSEGAGMVVATHDARLTALGDRVLHLEDGRLRAGG
jgi:ABC-type lipoprotein export system ATPase subunit